MSITNTKRTTRVGSGEVEEGVSLLIHTEIDKGSMYRGYKRRKTHRVVNWPGPFGVSRKRKFTEKFIKVTLVTPWKNTGGSWCRTTLPQSNMIGIESDTMSGNFESTLYNRLSDPFFIQPTNISWQGGVKPPVHFFIGDNRWHPNLTNSCY